MNKINPVQLSKTISLALRHEPEQFGLTLDPEGWVSLDDLIAALHQRKLAWQQVDASTIESILATSEKKRFEIRDGRIRAYYGHSVEEKIQKAPVVPPAALYHGTNAKAWETIRQTGLQPMGRQYVHLSTTFETAINVGERRTDDVVLIRVDAAAAYAAGHNFYHGNQDTWLADAVPAQFLSVEESRP